MVGLKLSEKYTKKCLVGDEHWFCNGCTGEFKGSQPDRTECVAAWVLDIQSMVSGYTGSKRN